MKRLFCLLLVLFLLPCLAYGEKKPKSFRSGDYDYVLLDDGTAEIVKYNGKAESFSIPEKIDNYQITSIGDKAFWGCSELRSITIPNSINTIGANPFANCEKLSRIILSPKHPTLAVIERVLFYKPDKRLVCYPIASEASSYTIPQGIKSIDDSAFFGCIGLTSITIPDSVTSIGDDAFWGCTGLTSITIPDSVTSIGDNAFVLCTGITSITIPSSVTFIGIAAFYGCDNLTITVSEGSYADDYCEENGFTYTFLNALDWLND